jgi:arylsulfatase A-like enzyme
LLAASLCGAAKPNIIVVLFDDLGGRELGCYGNAFNETPRIDKLASEGIQFNRAYAPTPICSPSRASLLTGEAPARHGITEAYFDRQVPQGGRLPYRHDRKMASGWRLPGTESHAEAARLR